MRVALHFLIGLVFGLGLVIAGMSNPAKVLAFLDVASIRDGAWDASLAFVMVGAVAVAFVGYRLAWARQAPLFDEKFYLPTRASVDAQLVAGAAIFGLGWGLAGICPGPAFTLLAAPSMNIALFVAAMFVGLWMARWWAARVAYPSHRA